MADQCFKCGIDENHALLFDTITLQGVEKVCRKCSFEIDTPIIRKVHQDKLRESQMKKSVYERLSDRAGLNAVEHHRKIHEAKQINEELANQDSSLREVVERNIIELSPDKGDERLIDNFHWIIMRKRRSMKLTQASLAKKIGEPELSVKSLERGILPRGYEIIIKKLETYLSIRVFREAQEPLRESVIDIDKMRQEFERKIEEQPKAVFDRKNPEQFTIGEMKEMKESFKLNPKIFEKPQERNLMIKGDKYGLGKEKINIEDEPEFIMESEEENKLREEVGEILDGGGIGKPPVEAPRGVYPKGTSSSSSPRDISEEMSTRGKEEKDLNEEEIRDLIFGRR